MEKLLDLERDLIGEGREIYMDGFEYGEFRECEVTGVSMIGVYYVTTRHLYGGGVEKTQHFSPWQRVIDIRIVHDEESVVTRGI